VLSFSAADVAVIAQWLILSSRRTPRLPPMGASIMPSPVAQRARARRLVRQAPAHKLAAAPRRQAPAIWVRVAAAALQQDAVRRRADFLAGAPQQPVPARVFLAVVAVQPRVAVQQVAVQQVVVLRVAEPPVAVAVEGAATPDAVARVRAVALVRVEHPGRSAVRARAAHPGRSVVRARAAHPGRSVVRARAAHPGRSVVRARAERQALQAQAVPRELQARVAPLAESSRAPRKRFCGTAGSSDSWADGGALRERRCSDTAAMGSIKKTRQAIRSN
jgi:hypothetical protein